MNPSIKIVAEAAELNANDVKPESLLSELTGWDSFCFMRLITLIESTYLIDMTAEDIVKLNSVKDVTAFLMSKEKIG
jgi:acyl carrier protein